MSSDLNNGVTTPGFDTRLFLADNRILPQPVALRDPQNPEVWVHPGDLQPGREEILQERLRSAYSVSYPPYGADKVRGRVIRAVGELIQIDPQSAEQQEPTPPQREAFPPNPYQYPLSQLNQGAPFPQPYGAEERQRTRDAVGIFLLLQDALEHKGYTSLIDDTIDSLERRGGECGRDDQANQLRRIARVGERAGLRPAICC
jgi:hypothetical protein